MAHSLLDQTTTSQWKVFFKAVFHSTNNRISLLSQGTSVYKPGYPRLCLQGNGQAVQEGNSVHSTTDSFWRYFCTHLWYRNQKALRLFNWHCKLPRIRWDKSNYCCSLQVYGEKSRLTPKKLTPTETTLTYMVNTIRNTGSLQDVCMSQCWK